MARREFPWYGWAGLAAMGAVSAMVALEFHGLGPTAAEQVFRQWTTPLSWWGYVLFADALLRRLAGWSMLRERRREFWLWWCPLSIAFWVVFEVYNLHLDNWTYVGLPGNLLVRGVGFAVAFATILPGMFLTAECVRASGVFRAVRIRPIRVSGGAAMATALVGLAMLVLPWLLPREWARYTFALVWMGMFFLLDPINLASGSRSVLREAERGSIESFLCYMAGGYACGLLWEVWNFWAHTKWVYTAPFTQDLRYFEMPIAGFLGFGPFALEFFAMYGFCRVFARDQDPEATPSAEPT